MTLIEQIRAMLRVYSVDDSTYTDSELELMASQARNMISEEVSPKIREDYRQEYTGKVYMTDYYPLLNVNAVEIVIDGENVTPHKITEDGIIYFETTVQGELICTYTQGLPVDVVESALISLVVYMIQNKGGTIGSIKEGDVSVSYDNNTSLSTGSQINRLLEGLRGKYKARIRLL